MVEVFSSNERLVLQIIGRRKMTVTELTHIFYDSKSQVRNDQEKQNYMAGVLRRIIRKCESHNLNWTLKREGSGGRGGLTVWRQTL